MKTFVCFDKSFNLKTTDIAGSSICGFSVFCMLLLCGGYMSYAGRKILGSFFTLVVFFIVTSSSRFIFAKENTNTELQKKDQNQCISMFMERFFPEGIYPLDRPVDRSTYQDNKEFLELKNIIKDLVSFEPEASEMDSLELFKTTPILRFHLFTLVTDILIHEDFSKADWSSSRTYLSFDEFIFKFMEKLWFSNTVTKAIDMIEDRILAYIHGRYEDEELNLPDEYGKTLSHMMLKIGNSLKLRTYPGKFRVYSFQDMLGFDVGKSSIKYTPLDLAAGLYYWFDYNKGNGINIGEKLINTTDPNSQDLSILTLYNSYCTFNHVQKVAFMSYLIKDDQISDGKLQAVAYLLGRYILDHSEDQFDKTLVKEFILNNTQLRTRLSIFIRSVPFME